MVAVSEREMTTAVTTWDSSWERGEKYERLLDSRGVSYELMRIPLSDIDRQKGLNNHGRLHHRVDQDVVQAGVIYVRDAGGKLPAVVMNFDDQTGKWYSTDGVHRMEIAFEAKMPWLLAYGIRVSESLSDMLCREFSAGEGAGQPPAEDRLQQAVYLHEHGGLSQREAALREHIEESRLSHEIKFREATGTLASLGAIGFGALSKGGIVALAAIQSDTVARAAVELAVKARLPEDLIRELVREVVTKRGGTDAQLAAVSAFAARPDIDARLGDQEAKRQHGQRARGRAQDVPLVEKRPTVRVLSPKIVASRNRWYGSITALLNVAQNNRAETAFPDEEIIRAVETLRTSVQGLEKWYGPAYKAAKNRKR